MISLLNKFSLIGILKECRIDLFPSHIKAKFNMEINNQEEITVYYSINKKFHNEKYKEFIQIIPKLHPVIQGYVWNGKIKYYSIFSNNLTEDSNNKLFISGNVLEKNDKIYFNGEYIKLTNLKNEFNFSLEGIIVNKNKILNIVNDSPRIFNIKTNIKPSGKVYNFSINYIPQYIIKNDNVYYNKQNYQFVYYNKQTTNKVINKNDVDNYLLEWEIINSDGE